MSHDQKQDEIIKAAVKRFSHFGVGKTTMSEIAGDLAISKASLYYYFPDKLSLFAAVFKSITSENEKEHTAHILGIEDPYEAVNVFLKRRIDFIVKYHNILEFIRTFKVSGATKEMQQIFSELKTKEVRLLQGIIDRGKQAGIFQIADVKATTELFFDFLDAHRTTFLLRNRDFFPGKKELQGLLRKEIEFAIIFFNGLTNQNQ